MFSVKICGVRLKADLRSARAAGVDAVGLNFYPPSVRFLDPAAVQTRALSREASESGLLRVGVFVDDSPARIARVAETVGLDAVQLHGDEPAETAARLRGEGFRVIRAVKLPPGPLSIGQIRDAIEPVVAAEMHPLLDADGGSQHGGTGRRLDWAAIGQWARAMPPRSWTLAGGLTPDNVAEAIRVTGATSVDVASGVERQRGTKDALLIERFLAEFRSGGG